MILDNEFTGDMRVENEVYSLSQAGFKVFVLCFNHGGKAEREEFHGGTIIRLNISKFRKNKMKGFTNTFLDPYTAYWAQKITRFVREHKIQTLHVHDLYLLGAAFKARRKLGTSIPIIGDLHENYPAALKHYRYVNKFPGKYIISVPKWERTEIEWIRKADHVITVIEEAVERYVGLGLPKEKLSVVANYVNPDFFLQGDVDAAIKEKFQGRFVLTYTGGFDAHRGIECTIRAMDLIRKKVPNALLVLVGTGANLQELEVLVSELKLSDHVSFEGWQKAEMMASYNQVSDICLIPHLKTEHTDHTIPHKLFQYMLLEKPVVSTDCKPLKRILEESHAGLSYASNDHEDMAKQIIYLYEHPEERQRMGRNGAMAVQDRYTWDATAKNLITLYQEIEVKVTKPS